jgi:hypothetical protein
MEQIYDPCDYKDMEPADTTSQKISHSMKSSIYRYFKRQSQALVSGSNEEITNVSLDHHNHQIENRINLDTLDERKDKEGSIPYSSLHTTILDPPEIDLVNITRRFVVPSFIKPENDP